MGARCTVRGKQEDVLKSAKRPTTNQHTKRGYIPVDLGELVRQTDGEQYAK